VVDYLVSVALPVDDHQVVHSWCTRHCSAAATDHARATPSWQCTDSVHPLAVCGHCHLPL
jgi:hypothetical protein